MASAQGRCTNFDHCVLAERRTLVTLPDDAPFLCTVCRQPLNLPPVAPNTGIRLFALLGLLALVVVGGGTFAVMKLAHKAPDRSVPPPWLAARQAPKPPVLGPAPRPAAPAMVPETIVLRLSTAGGLAADLAERLVAAFLASTGNTHVTAPPAAESAAIRVTGMHGTRQDAVTIAAAGSTVAIADLGHNAADVALTARPITPAEHDSLSALGDLYDQAAEHLLAMDGIAIIVNRANPIGALTTGQVRDMLDGDVTRWPGHGGPGLDIHVLVPAARTIAGDLLDSTLMQSHAFAPAARTIAGGTALAAAVAADAGALGVVALPDMLGARALPIAAPGAAPVAPNRLTVATEEYPLARGMFLYAPTRTVNKLVPGFAAFALSPKGQAIVEQAGFVPLTLVAQPDPGPPSAPAGVRAMLSGADRISVDFRFRPDSPTLDNRARADIERLIEFVARAHISPRRLLLAGFADRPTEAESLDVSRWRIATVAAALAARGVKVGHSAAFGAASPVADGASEEGRVRNTRVEVFVLR
jgi:phosphate transport system substrate-binding protein